MTTQLAPADLARAFIETWAKSDMEDLATYAAADISYGGPLTSAERVEAYLSAVGAFSELVSQGRILAALGDDDQARSDHVRRGDRAVRHAPRGRAARLSGRPHRRQQACLRHLPDTQGAVVGSPRPARWARLSEPPA